MAVYLFHTALVHIRHYFIIEFDLFIEALRILEEITIVASSWNFVSDSFKCILVDTHYVGVFIVVILDICFETRIWIRSTTVIEYRVVVLAQMVHGKGVLG